MKRERIVEGVREHEGRSGDARAAARPAHRRRRARDRGYFYALELVKDKETKETFSDEECETLLRGFVSPALYEARVDLPGRRSRRPRDPDLAAAGRARAEFDQMVGILGDVLAEAWSRWTGSRAVNRTPGGAPFASVGPSRCRSWGRTMESGANGAVVVAHDWRAATARAKRASTRSAASRSRSVAAS